MMTTGRLAGDRLAVRFGPVALVRGCGLLAAAGLGTGADGRASGAGGGRVRVLRGGVVVHRAAGVLRRRASRSGVRGAGARAGGEHRLSGVPVRARAHRGHRRAVRAAAGAGRTGAACRLRGAGRVRAQRPSPLQSKQTAGRLGGIHVAPAHQDRGPAVRRLFARTCVRLPCLPKRRRISTGRPPALPNPSAFHPDFPGIGNRGCRHQPGGCTLPGMSPHNDSGPGHDHTDAGGAAMAAPPANGGEPRPPLLPRTATPLGEPPDPEKEVRRILDLGVRVTVRSSC